MSGKTLFASSTLVLALLASPNITPAHAQTAPSLSDYRAFAEFRDTCPGDRVVSQSDDGTEILGAALGGLVTALLGAVVNKGIGRLGKKLKEASQEQITENIHTGDTFHSLTVNKEENKPVFSLHHNCLVIVTAPTTRRANSFFTTDDKTETNWPDYHARSVYQGTRKSIECTSDGKDVVAVTDLDSNESYSGQTCMGIDPEDGKLKSFERTFQAEDGLTEFLTSAGYTASGDYSQPSSILVMDIEYSLGNTYFRFVPRYFAVPHSAREAIVDTKQRDFSFEFKLALPGEEKPFAADMIAFERMRLQDPFSHMPTDSADSRSMTSAWFATPPQETAVVSVYNLLAADIGSIRATQDTALELSREARNNFAGFKRTDDNTPAEWENKFSMNTAFPEVVREIWGEFQINNDLTTDPIQICPALAVARQELAKVRTQGLLLSALRSQYESLKSVEELETALTSFQSYYSACVQAGEKQEKIDDLRVPPGSDGGITPFDFDVTIKEFRRRPITEFFADVLSDEGFQKSATESVLDLIDPATIAQNQKEKEDELNEARGSLDEAIVEAENERDMLDELEVALEVMESADEPDLVKIAEQNRKIRSQRRTLESKQRAANRAAIELSIDLPYPAQGLFLQSGGQ